MLMKATQDYLIERMIFISKNINYGIQSKLSLQRGKKDLVQFFTIKKST